MEKAPGTSLLARMLGGQVRKGSAAWGKRSPDQKMMAAVPNTETGHLLKHLTRRKPGFYLVSVHKRASLPVMDSLRKNVVLLRSHFQ
jgi:hypothetical protein